MSNLRTLIVPGYRGSGPDHWQSWLEQQLPNTTRINGIDWNEPVLAQWAGRVRDALAQAEQPLRVIAHSFGSLAAVVAAADRPEQVAQLILVAPANPARFDCMGLKPELFEHSDRFLISQVLPRRSLQVQGLLIGSRNDPWLSFDQAAELANNWKLDFHDAGYAGHINSESSYGPWPKLLTLLEQQCVQPHQITGSAIPHLRKGRGSTLAAVRQLTREQLQSPQDHRLWQTPAEHRA